MCGVFIVIWSGERKPREQKTQMNKKLEASQYLVALLSLLF